MINSDTNHMSESYLVMFIYIWHLLHEDCSLYKPSDRFKFGNFGVEGFEHRKIGKTLDLHHLKTQKFK